MGPTSCPGVNVPPLDVPAAFVAVANALKYFCVELKSA